MLPDDWQKEKLLTIAEAAELLGKSENAVTSYIDQGSVPKGRGRDAPRVYLECVKIGVLKTSVEAINRFVERCSPLPKDQTQRTPAEARRAGKRAGEQLREELARDRERHQRPAQSAAT